MTGFVFFDTETTGLKKGFDQIIHFAAVRTNHELNELDRFEAYSRLQPHVVPHPAALLTNGLRIGELTDPERPSHYDMIGAIGRKLTEWSPAIFVGYNSISFDEEMLRHALFQALHNPYLTSGRGCGRADAMALALAAHALPPQCMIAPVRADGRKSFRLPDIAEANGLSHVRAHDALADALVTLDLCRLVRDRAYDTWQRFQRFANKAAVADFVASEDGFVLTEFFGGEARHRSVGLLGSVPGNANGRFCLDLTADPDHLAEMSDEELRQEICRKGTPVRRLATNACPALTELWSAPAELLGDLDVDTAEERARRMKDDADLCARIISVYTATWEERPLSPFPERQLYDGGFPGDADSQRRFDFHDAPRDQRLGIVRNFDDPRLTTFGLRLIHAEHRSSLPEAERLAADLDLAERLVEERDGPLTLGGALAAVDELMASGAADPIGLLPDYRGWIMERIERIDRFRSERHSEVR
ncbi:exonuclease domain-containing protein [Ancylobacter sp. G4_0304]|uniref:exonuclease domain-containing protein n=1 Tax=Ancylobacter sp. G4_0304 TaxID=3114289 RepID=UPI0039C6CB72